MRDDPSVTASPCHIPLHKGAFGCATGERQWGEEQGQFSDLHDLPTGVDMRDRAINECLGIAHPVGEFWTSWAVSTTTPVCPKRSFGTKKQFSFTPCTVRLSPPKCRRFAAVGSDTRLRTQTFDASKESGGCKKVPSMAMDKEEGRALLVLLLVHNCGKLSP